LIFFVQLRIAITDVKIYLPIFSIKEAAFRCPLTS